MSQILEIAVWHSGPLSHVKCSGEIDATTAGELERAFSIVIETAPTAILLHGEEISLLTSAGVEVLVDGVRECRRRNIEFRAKFKS